MVNTDINLLPDQAIEALHHDSQYRQKLYFLIAIVSVLLVITVLGIIVTLMYAKTVDGNQALLQYQNQRLENLNPLWNDIIRLNQNISLYSGVSENSEQIASVFASVVSGLGSLQINSFDNTEPGAYSVELIAPSKEESKSFVTYLADNLPEAKVQQIETIRETDTEVFFRITIRF